ncbi:thioredoxin domain-containing protein 15-like isoform X1 [Rhinatrema bivittatum]|uniref:thioredoxin domain-containing protein 15-like isoform X1 n=1 Tax=Rhinatrema bivittatum TaxID=194408 RepID=UPI00112C00CA|nr:thioredoxin domain-containing protein 15-like isoform X1 [Rhinatrema bivittatum]
MRRELSRSLEGDTSRLLPPQSLRPQHSAIKGRRQAAQAQKAGGEALATRKQSGRASRKQEAAPGFSLGCRGDSARCLGLSMWPSPFHSLRLWVLALSFLAASITGEENVNLQSTQQSKTDLSSSQESITLPLSDEESQSVRTVQYKTAEIADAMLGTELHQDHSFLLSMIPGEAKDRHAGDSAAATCDAAREGAECMNQDNLASSLKEIEDIQEGERVQGSNVQPEMTPAESSKPEESNNTENTKSPKVNCEERNLTGIEDFTLQVLNVSEDLMEVLNPNSSECTLVLFFTPWCRFSAGLAPHFNSLPRAFPALHFLALDASQHSSLSTRFGTVAVPNILLFQGAKPMARFNHTDRTLETLKAFIFNQSGIEAKNDVVVTEEDHEGPLPSTPLKGIDWLLVFSLLFLAAFVMYATIRTESIRWLIPGQEQEHQD